jgi:hypothetical protein
MWVKCTEEEIAQAKARKQRQRMRWAIISGVIICLLFGFIRSKRWRRHGYDSRLVRWGEVPGRLLFSIPFGIIGGYLLYRFELKPKRFMVCPKCEITTQDDAELKCGCGGRFEHLDTMKWI